MITEQQKARIVELARKCEVARMLANRGAEHAYMGVWFDSSLSAMRHSAEAFRIAQNGA